MKPQIFKTDGGEELVILSRRDYDLLLARLGDEEAELRFLDAKAREIECKIASGEESYLPEWLSAAILRSENLFKVSRLRIGRDVSDVAAAVDIPVRELEAIEASGGVPSVELLAKLSEALEVDLTWMRSKNDVHVESPAPNSSGK